MNEPSQTQCAACRGARVEVILGSVIPCGRCDGSGQEPQARPPDAGPVSWARMFEIDGSTIDEL